MPWRTCGFDSRWALLQADLFQDVGKPGIPRASGARDRRFKSGRPDFDCGGARAGTGGRLLSVTSQVRFLPPQPSGRASQLAMARAFEAGRALLPCGFDSRSFRLDSTCPWPIGSGTSLPSWTGGFDSRRALCKSGDGLTVRFLALNQAMGVRFPLPEPRHTTWHAAADRVIDQLLRGRLTVGRDALNVLVLVRFQPPQLADGSHPAG